MPAEAEATKDINYVATKQQSNNKERSNKAAGNVQ